jgi:predicted AlkP superfamily phosphohydrolase/phosphomutase
MTTSESERVFVLRIDGIPWDLLSKWSRKAELFNFKQIFEEGASDPLKSTVSRHPSSAKRRTA